MEPRKISAKLRLALNLLIGIFVLVLTLSFFFGFITILRKGVSENTPITLTLFDLLDYNDPLLMLAFVSAIMTIICGLVIIVITALEITGRIHSELVKDIFGVASMVFAILSFILILVYCKQNTPDTNTATSYLKFVPAAWSYVLLIAGIGVGVTSLIDTPVMIEDSTRRKNGKAKSKKTNL